MGVDDFAQSFKYLFGLRIESLLFRRTFLIDLLDELRYDAIKCLIECSDFVFGIFAVCLAENLVSEFLRTIGSNQ